ncbi:hypothetical protein, conserved [Eimeria tenella]|uniref:Uncharacterized protein n=1 Tax=Eimeria tenella TaxID=5802 RepID=U6KMZ9_EIMTE|nr:hypothetical protein, conserved [Eimeria tenella]CDJ37667.1 hypothetical protein, conserved [Eimeria tenella]|eukprot:XP_013228505.1 hypothetical protein, conserved [Eimeria tenella]
MLQSLGPKPQFKFAAAKFDAALCERMAAASRRIPSVQIGNLPQQQQQQQRQEQQQQQLQQQQNGYRLPRKRQRCTESN